MNLRARWSLIAALLALSWTTAGCDAGAPAVVEGNLGDQSGYVSAVTQPESIHSAVPLNESGDAADTKPDSAVFAAAKPLCVPQPAEAAAKVPARRYVNVNVATLWASPQSPRALDEPSLRFPADVPAWLGPMSVRDKLALVGRTETEALYGDPVELLEERGDWAKVAVPAQRTPQLAQGYPGWLPKRQLTARSEAAAYAGCPVAVIDKPTAPLYEDAELRKPELQLSFGTQLPVMAAAADGTLAVMTPGGGRRFIAAADAAIRDPGAVIAPPSGKQLVELGRRFLGIPYVWAGASGFGFDCSGFTYSLYRYYGTLLPRDAKDQAKEGRAVDRGSLQPGDLLFFAYDKGKGAIHHVAMYAGDGNMLHSPKTERSVELIALDTPEYAAEFAGARRFLP